MSESRAAYMREYRAKRAASLSDNGLLPFQQSFVDAVCRVNHPPDIAALSCPRGNGKIVVMRQVGSSIAHSLAIRFTSPLLKTFLVAAISARKRESYWSLRGPHWGSRAAYRWRVDGGIHIDSSDAGEGFELADSRRALGIGANVRIVIADEPGAWSPTAGRRLWDAITTALGQAAHDSCGSWHLGTCAVDWSCERGGRRLCRLAAVTGRHVSLLQSDPEKWTDFDEVLRVQSCCGHQSIHLRRALEREHKVALGSDRAARTFKQYRLNIPGDPVDTQPLITAAEWARVTCEVRS